MALFGTGSPKIKTSGGTELALTYAKVLKDEPEWDTIYHENPISGERVLVRSKYHWIYEIELNLYKFAVPLTTYTALNAALYDEVQLFRHNEAEPVCDVDGNVVNFWFKEIIPYYLTTTDFKDGLILKFQSLGWVDLSKSLYGYIVDDESLDNILDDESGDSFVTG
jgi:hypothetical protein